MPGYDPTSLEKKWQKCWLEHKTFAAVMDAAKPKFYALDMFPYPSGEGLHVGHPEGYTATDIISRYKRGKGFAVMHPMGWDAFGLPAEQYAIKTNTHPRQRTKQNIDRFRAQLQSLGFSYDWDREVDTTDPHYFKWTQWIFLRLYDTWFDAEANKGRPICELIAEFESGRRTTPEIQKVGGWTKLSTAQRAKVLAGYRLAYESEVPVNWCQGLGTVLANEEVIDGKSEVGGFPVERKPMRQWMLRITAYAQRLIDGLDSLEWSDSLKEMQRNWIGRSDGAMVDFSIDGHPDKLTVFTTRPDTLFGVTYMVMAPEHPMVEALTTAQQKEKVEAYRKWAAGRSDRERQEDTRKTGEFTGTYAINPVNQDRIPIYISDYVLMGYGTGAIMAVPGGDQRDFEFATSMGLPVVYTVQPPEGHEGAWQGDGEIINSANDEVSLDGLSVADAKRRIVDWLGEHGLGESTTTYRLRDWLFSRQRYWGEPFPIVWDADDRPHALPESELPLELPDVPDYAPRTFDPTDKATSPEAPLSRNEDWTRVTLDLGDGPREYRRDTNTMPNWAGSCWYYLRYLDPTEAGVVVDPELDRYWMSPGHNPTSGPGGGVDLYVGGVEHAVLHLLYARFWHKVLYDLGYVSSVEPFGKLFNQGYIQAYAYTDARGAYVPAAEVVEEPGPDGEPVYRWNGEAVSREYGKIGKSLKNAVTPDEMYEAYGADTFRVYEMSMGPLDLSRPWETRAVVGAQRFLQRLWRNVISEETGEVTVTDEPAGEETRRALHRAIAGARTEFQNMRPNTAIAKLITLNNHLTGLNRVPREAVEPLVLMTSPVAPHIAEELWSRLGHDESLAYESFPVADEAYLVEETVTCVVQVAGKVRARLEVPPTVEDNELRDLALAEPNVHRALDGRDVRTVVVRAPGLVNVVPA